MCYFFSREKVTKKSASFSQEKKKQKEQFADERVYSIKFTHGNDTVASMKSS